MSDPIDFSTVCPIAIVTFNPYNSATPKNNIVSTFGPLAGDSVFSLGGPTNKNITVTLTGEQQGPVQINYHWPMGSPYLFSGLSFMPSKANPEAPTEGLEQFPEFTIAAPTATAPSQLSLTIACDPTFSGTPFKYWIVIQRRADGALGVVDPYDEAETPPSK